MMKNIKNTVAAMGLMAVLGMGSMTANAGIMLGDRNATPQPVCNSGAGMMNNAEGIIIVGFSGSRFGLMLADRIASVFGSQSNTPCVQQNQPETMNSDGIIIVG